MTRCALGVACLLLLGGCADQVRDFAREPGLTPVGAGLRPNRVAVLSEPPPGRTPASISSAIRAPCESATW
jgi:flagellar L-ring protein precursor FlgH